MGYYGIIAKASSKVFHVIMYLRRCSHQRCSKNTFFTERLWTTASVYAIFQNTSLSWRALHKTIYILQWRFTHDINQTTLSGASVVNEYDEKSYEKNGDYLTSPFALDVLHWNFMVTSCIMFWLKIAVRRKALSI